MHPELAAYDILRVIVNEVKPKVENHEYSVEIECTQWFPQPKPRVVGPLKASDIAQTSETSKDLQKEIDAKRPSAVLRGPR